MTPSKKLFLAATLVAAGYGVAALMGAPDPRQWPESLAQDLPTSDRVVLSAQPSMNPGRVGSVRLLPDTMTAAETQLPGDDKVAVPAPKATAPSLMRSTSSTGVTSTALNSGPSPSLLGRQPRTRGSLKDEAPRALPDTGRMAPPTRQRQVDKIAYDQPVSPQSANVEPRVLSAGFAPAPLPATATIRAATDSSPQIPTELRGAPLSSSPPWMIADVVNESVRTHIVVDGDSLAKLAGRYLDDPRRSEEIFSLNRGVLSDPELLPIGTEIKIPPRGPRADRPSWPQSQLTGPAAVHAAEHTGWAPPRALPQTSPRAQLLPPQPIE